MKLFKAIFNLVILLLLLVLSAEAKFILSGGDTGQSGIADQPGDTILTWNIAGTTFYLQSNVAVVEVTSGTFIFNSSGGELNNSISSIIIPPQSLGQNVYIFISTNPVDSPYLVNPEDIFRANSNLSRNHYLVPGSILEIALQDEQHNWIQNLTLNKPIEIQIKYPDNNNDGYVDALTRKIKTSDLKIYYLNEVAGTWQEIPETVTSPTEKYITGQITHFSVYALIGKSIPEDLSEVTVYPVPYKPQSGGPYDNPEGIIFDHVPEYLNIKIFNIAAELVFDDTINSTGGKYTWKTTNNAGEKVASGIYIFILSDSSGNKKIGKLAIIR